MGTNFITDRAKYNAKGLERIAKLIKDYREGIDCVYARYRKDVAEAKKVYSAEVASDKIKTAKRLAQFEAKTVENKFVTAVKVELDGLGSYIKSVVNIPIDSGFERTMRCYKDFGIELTVSEAEVFASHNFDSYPALRLLARVAKASNINVNIPSVKQLEDDLKKLAALTRTPNLYSPAGYETEAYELLPDVPMYNAEGKQYGTQGRPDFAAVQSHRAALGSFEREIDGKIAPRWNVLGGKIAVEEAKNYTEKQQIIENFIPELGISVDTEAQKAIDHAKAQEEARKNAEADRKAAEIIAKYM